MAAQSARADPSRLSVGAGSRRGPAVALCELHTRCVGRLAGQLHPKASALPCNTTCGGAGVFPHPPRLCKQNWMCEHFLLFPLRIKSHSHQLTRGKEASRMHLKRLDSTTLKVFPNLHGFMILRNQL